MIDTDDVGNPHGNIRLPFADEARKSVREWKFTAVGRRPADWAGRDLLQVGLRTDRRCWQYHALLKFKPSWLGENRPLASEQFHVLMNARIIHYLHCQRMLGVANLEDQFVTDRAWKTIRCRPTQAMFRIQDLPAKKQPRSCRMAQICPFCKERMARKLFRELAGVTSSSSCCLLVSFRSAPFGIEANCSENEASLHRQVLLSKLTSFKRIMRPLGGFYTLSFFPILEATPIWEADEMRFDAQRGLGLRLAAIAEVDSSQDECERRLMEFHSELCLQRSQEVDGPTLDRPIIARSDDPQTLRQLIFGSQSTGVVANCKSHPDHRAGMLGAFIYPPWIISSNQQIEACVRQSKHVRAFEKWGEWRKRAADRKPKRVCDWEPERLRRVKNGRRSRLKPINDRRKQSAQALFEQVVQQHQGIMTEAAEQRWGHVLLRRAFEAQSEVISISLAKKIVKSLK